VRAERQGLPSSAIPGDPYPYEWVYDDTTRNVVHEYAWELAENRIDLVYAPTGRSARNVNGSWVLEM